MNVNESLTFDRRVVIDRAVDAFTAIRLREGHALTFHDTIAKIRGDFFLDHIESLTFLELCLREEIPRFPDRLATDYDHPDLTPEERRILYWLFAGLRPHLPIEWEDLRVLVLESEPPPRSVGSGGFGEVFLAQKRLGPTAFDVAVKVLNEITVDDGGKLRDRHLARFSREARALARLRQHSRVVQVIEMGFWGVGPDQRLGIVMEYLPGGSIEDHKLNYWDPTKAAVLVKKIAEALQDVHDAEVLHRDLKPANILLDAKGEPVLTDFGLAKEIGADDGLTKTGTILGSPGFAAPEQVRGKNFGAATDIFSLGAILYYLVTGEHIFPEEVYVRRVVEEDVKPARIRRCETLDDSSTGRSGPRKLGDLDAVIQRCLCRAPGGRYASANELACELHRYIIGEPVHAARFSPFRTAKWWLVCRPLKAAAIAIVMITLGSLIGVGLLRERHATRLSRLGEERRAQISYAATLLRSASAKDSHEDVSTLDAASNQLDESNLDSVSAVVQHMELAGGYRRLRHYEKAEMHNRAAVRILKSVNDEAMKGVPLMELGKTLFIAGRFREAEDILRQTIEIYRRHLETYSYARTGLADALTHFASVLERRSALDQAESAARESLTLRLESRVDQGAIALTRVVLGEVLRGQGRLLLAESQLREGIDVLQKTYGLTDARAVSAAIQLGITLYKLDRFEEASAMLEDSEQVAHEPEIALMDIAACKLFLGFAEAKNGHLPKARSLIRTALDIYERYGNRSVFTHSLIEASGAVIDVDIDESWTCIVRAQSICRDNPKEYATAIGPAYAGAIANQVRRGRPQRVPGLCLEVLRLLDLGAKPPPQDSLRIWETLMVGMIQKNPRGTLKTLQQEWAEVLERKKADRDVEAALWCALILADFTAYDRTQRETEPRRAAILLEYSLNSFLERFDIDRPEVIRANYVLGRLTHRMRKDSDAQSHYQAALEALLRVDPDNTEYLSEFETCIGDVMTDRCMFREAEQHLLRGLEHRLSRVGRLSTFSADYAFSEVVRLYAIWHTMEPWSGYDAKANRWRAEWSKWRESTKPPDEAINALFPIDN